MPSLGLRQRVLSLQPRLAEGGPSDSPPQAWPCHPPPVALGKQACAWLLTPEHATRRAPTAACECAHSSPGAAQGPHPSDSALQAESLSGSGMLGRDGWLNRAPPPSGVTQPPPPPPSLTLGGAGVPPMYHLQGHVAFNVLDALGRWGGTWAGLAKPCPCAPPLLATRRNGRTRPPRSGVLPGCPPVALLQAPCASHGRRRGAWPLQAPPSHLYYLRGRSICSHEAAATFVLMCVCVCVCLCAGYPHCYQVSRLSLYGILWHPRVGSLPIGEAHGAGQGCVCVLPLHQWDMHFRPEPGSLPQDHPGSGWWFCWAGSTVLVQRALAIVIAAPCVVCILGLAQLVVLAAVRRPPRPTQFGDFPGKDALDTRLPPPASRHAESGNRSHHLSVARPTLSLVELTRDPRVCVCVCVCDGLKQKYSQTARLKD